MMRWFGPDTNAPFIKDDLERVGAPAGQTCFHCDEPILETEYGFTMDHVDAQGCSPRPYHHECMARQLLGSFAHQAGVCRCPSCGAIAPQDDSLFSTRRNAARAALILADLLRSKNRHRP